MKRRFYLRGIGVGLVLAVILYSTIIIPRKYELTDEEIMARAEQLGMVVKEEVQLPEPTPSEEPTPSVTEEATPEPTKPEMPTKPEEPTLKPSPTEAPQPTMTPIPTPTKMSEPTTSPIPTEAPKPTITLRPTATIQPTPTEIPKPTITVRPTEAPQPTATSAPTAMPTAVPTQAPESGEGKLLSVTVVAGMGSAEFARAAKKAGLVENAEEFDVYLMRNGYASDIRIGTYQLPEGASYYEIAEAVTAR